MYAPIIQDVSSAPPDVHLAPGVGAEISQRNQWLAIRLCEALLGAPIGPRPPDRLDAAREGSPIRRRIPQQRAEVVSPRRVEAGEERAISGESRPVAGATEWGGG